MGASRTARAQARQLLTDEIKRAARDELAVAGSAGLSLRAVARRVEMVPSALYRYFDDRDSLLTALIVDAYEALTVAVAEADRAAGSSARRRWSAVGHAVRAWALEHPHEWSLLYGSPVPGYRAPEATLEPGTGVVRIFLAIVASEHGSGRTSGEMPVTPPLGRELRRWLRALLDPGMAVLPEPVLALAVYAYTQMLGSVSLELFGQFGPAATPAPAMFDHGLRVSATLLGLSGPA